MIETVALVLAAGAIVHLLARLCAAARASAADAGCRPLFAWLVGAAPALLFVVLLACVLTSGA